ncbi:MAG: glycosyltransferase family 2 protein [Oligoflexia bacterium]|nr:glycosyltransferase family 2 protein [Oligoflexia bacterium]MBF0366660.1 glycosyltransferase family 2 protein [Oligoflexia bacterium]
MKENKISMELICESSAASLQWGQEVAIIAPAYNEEASIEDFVEEWMVVANKCGGNLIVLNDGSKDQTLTRLKELSARPKYSRLIVLNKKNSGHGHTCLQAYKWALAHHYQWIFQTDSDRQTRPEEFFTLWEARDANDFLFGNRQVRGDGKARWLVSKILRFIIWIIFGTYVIDANVPFRLMRSSCLQALLTKIPEEIFLINSYLAILASKNRSHRIRWFSITFRPRERGENSINLRRIVKLGVRAIREFYQLKKIN